MASAASLTLIIGEGYILRIAQAQLNRVNASEAGKFRLALARREGAEHCLCLRQGGELFDFKI